MPQSRKSDTARSGGRADAPVAITGVGPLLHQWRERRRMSQLDLSLEAEISARHLSFVETGRAHPSRDMVLLLARVLDVPPRARNELLTAAGFAPMYRERPLDAPELSQVRRAPRLHAQAAGAVPRARPRPPLEHPDDQRAAGRVMACSSTRRAAEALSACRTRCPTSHPPFGRTS
jgi:transcriptional regulator with XRE-family HTH domain